MTSRRSFLALLAGDPALRIPDAEGNTIAMVQRDGVILGRPRQDYAEFLAWMMRDLSAVNGIPRSFLEKVAEDAVKT